MLKRFLFSVVLMGLLVLFMEPAGNLLSNFLRLDQPRTHQIAEGDWLSKVAKKYYGDASYWQELALINRAPDGDLIFPGEEIIVPSFEAIREVRTSRRLSAVNDIVEMQQDILAGRMEVEREPVAQAPPKTEEPEGTTEPMPGEASDSDGETAALDLEDHYGSESSEAAPFYRSTLFITGMVILAVVLAIAIFMYVRQKKREKEEVSYYGSSDADAEQDEKAARSIFRFGEEKKPDNGSGKKRQKQKEEELVH